LSPELVSEFLQILGFVHTKIFFHRQLYHGEKVQLYTVVGHRKGAAAAQRDIRGTESDSALSIEKHFMRRVIRVLASRLVSKSRRQRGGQSD
jgi:hypothetical protein